MKLRDLFDKMISGVLDTHVSIRLEKQFDQYDGYDLVGEKIISRKLTSKIRRPLKAVEIEEDGSVTLVVEE